MELSKLMPFFCLISLSLCNREVPTQKNLPNDTSIKWLPLQTIPTIEHPKYGYFRRVNTLTNNLRQCFCFLQKPTGISVVQKLNSAGENLERLVVYLYRDASSADIKFYLPNNEKQIMIPDLALDEGDRFETLSAKTIEALFTKHSELVTNPTHIIFPDIAHVIQPEKLSKNMKDPSFYLKILKELIPKELIVNEIEKPIHIQNNLNPGYEILTEDNIEQENINFNANFQPNQYQIITVNGVEQLDLDLPLNIKPDQVNKTKNDDTNQKVFNFKPEPFNRSSEDIKKQTEINMQINYNSEVLNITTDGETEVLNVNTAQENSNMPSDNVYVEPNFNLNNQKFQPEIFIISAVNEIETPTVEPENLSNLIKDVIANDKPEESKLPNKEIIKYEGPEIIESEQNIYEYNMIWPVLTDNDVSSGNSPAKYSFQRPQLILSDKFKLPLTPFDNDNKVYENNKFPVYVQFTTQNQLQYFKDKLLHMNPTGPNNLSVITLRPQKLTKKYREQNEHKTNAGDLRDTFDTWFNEQVKRVQFYDSEASNSIDIYTFKYLVEKTLRDNGLFVTEKGLLSDSNGNVLKTANLNLRPILIGKTVEYKNLLQGKLTTFKLPTDLPYLEAVLVTSHNPPKILGIIPLGKTYLPKSYSNPLSLYVENDSDQVIPGCGHTCKMGRFLIPRYQLHNNIKSSYRGNDHRHYRPTSENLLQLEPYSQILPNRNPYFNKLLPQPPNPLHVKHNPVMTKEPFLFDQIKLILNKKTNVEDGHNTAVFKYGDKSTETTENIEYPVTAPEEKPGFRIIGGHAATSSGTPVSNKGRSGQSSSENSLESLDDYEVIYMT